MTRRHIHKSVEDQNCETSVAAKVLGPQQVATAQSGFNTSLSGNRVRGRPVACSRHRQGTEEGIDRMYFTTPDFKGLKRNKGVSFSICRAGETKIHPQQHNTFCFIHSSNACYDTRVQDDILRIHTAILATASSSGCYHSIFNPVGFRSKGRFSINKTAETKAFGICESGPDQRIT